MAILVHISKTMFASASRRTCSVQGIAPFGEDIALLVYILEEGISSPRRASSAAVEKGKAGEACRPEVGSMPHHHQIIERATS